MKIIKALKKDSLIIAEIEWKSGYAGNGSLKECLKRAQELFTKNNHNYILELSKKPCGYFSIEIGKSKKICHINYFAVKKSQRGKGLGSLMLKKLISLAKKEKCKAILLDVRNNNFPAIRLYTKFGFYVIKINKRLPSGILKLLMKKDL